MCIEDVEDLSSDHSSLLLTTVSATVVIRRDQEVTFANKYNDWDRFRYKLD